MPRPDRGAEERGAQGDGDEGVPREGGAVPVVAAVGGDLRRRAEDATQEVRPVEVEMIGEASSFALRTRVFPFRTIFISTVRPAGVSRIRRRNSALLRTRMPSNSMIASPASMPAFSAALSFWTLLTMAPATAGNFNSCAFSAVTSPRVTPKCAAPSFITKNCADSGGSGGSGASGGSGGSGGSGATCGAGWRFGTF